MGPRGPTPVQFEASSRLRLGKGGCAVDYGIVVVACIIGGACNVEAPMMYSSGASVAESCSAAQQTMILDGIGAVLRDDLAGMPDGFTRANHGAAIPIADALRARRVDRLILRCVEWTPTGGRPRRGRTVNETAYSRAQLDQLFAARTRR